MRAPLLALMLSVGRAAWPCDLSGAWYDNSGNLATIAQNSAGGLEVTAVSPTSWLTATGELTGNGTTLELSFGGAAPMDAVVSPSCWTLRFANMQQWQRGETFDNITTVHLIYMVHLDIGFTDLARGVCELYFDKHYPNVCSVCAGLGLPHRATPKPPSPTRLSPLRRPSLLVAAQSSMRGLRTLG